MKSEALVGAQVEGYRLLGVAGKGAMGEVHRAVDLRTGRPAAIKLLPPPSGDHDRIRWDREAAALERVEEEAVVAFLGRGQLADGRLWLAMEWVEGETLSAYLRRRGRLDESECRSLFARLARGLAAVHGAGIVHRDVKPSNILLVGGRLEDAKIADFGLARASEDARATVTGVQIGTPSYMAPEQARGERSAAPTADIFSLGAVFYECITGRTPFPGRNAIVVLARLLTEVPHRARLRARWTPPAIDALIASMLARSPAARPADAGMLVAALTEAWSAPRTSVQDENLAVSDAEHRPATVLLARQAASAAGSTRTVRSGDDRTGDGKTGDTDRFESTCEQFGGRVETFADGTLVAVFSSPNAPRDQAILALRAALTLRSSEPSLRVSVATGRVLVAPDHEEEASGEAAELALSLLDDTSADAVRVDDVTAGLVAGAFVIEKGRVISEGAASGGDLRVRGRHLPCVGREHELGTLEFIVHGTARDSVVRAALVIAPPGGGKTRLHAELETRLSASPYTFLSARADPLTRDRPLALLSSLISDLEEREAPRGAAADPFLVRSRLLQRTTTWLVARARERPVVLLLDDVHWADAPSIELLDEALQGAPDIPVAVVAFARPEVRERHPQAFQAHGLHKLVLPKLPARSAEFLLRTAFAGEPLAPPALAQLVALADGNPLFLEELVRAELRAESTNGTPRTIVTLLQARCAAQPSLERRVLRAASVLGLSFDAASVGALARGTGAQTEVDGALAALVRAELVVRDPLLSGTYRFRHPLMRDAAYSLLTDEDRVTAHARALELGEAAGLAPAALEAHARHASRNDRAAYWALRAAEESFAANDMPTVLAFVERGLAASASDELRGELSALGGLASFFSGQLGGAIELITRGLELAPPTSTWWVRAVGYLFVILAHVGPPQKGAVLYTNLRALASREPLEHEWPAVCESLAMALNSDIGADGPLADRLAERLLELLDRAPADAHVARGWAHHGLSWYALLGGRTEIDAQAHAQQAAIAFERGEDIRNLLASRGLLGIALVAPPDTSEALRARALEETDASVAIGQRLGGFPLIYARTLRGIVLAELLADAPEPSSDHLAREMEEHGTFLLASFGFSAFVSGHAEAMLARVRLREGNRVAAGEHAERAAAAFDRAGLSLMKLRVTAIALACGSEDAPGMAEHLLTRVGPHVWGRHRLEQALASRPTRH